MLKGEQEMGGVYLGVLQASFPCIVIFFLNCEHCLHESLFRVIDYSDKVDSGMIELDLNGGVFL